MIRYRHSDMHSRGVLPFLEIQNRAKQFTKMHLEFREIGEIASEDGRKIMDHKKNSKNDIKGGKVEGKIQVRTNLFLSPMESRISVVGKFPYGQVNSLLDLRPL